MNKIILFFVVTLVLFSCRENKDIVTQDTKEYPTERFVNTSLKGVVVGERGKVLKGAVVRVGDNSLKTDFNGTFYFENIKAKKSGAIIEISKESYTSKKKVFYPELNSTSYVRIKLKVGKRSIVIPTDKVDKNFGDEKHIIKILGNKFVENGTNFTGKLIVEWTGVMESELLTDQIAAPIGYTKNIELVGLNSFGMIGINLFDINHKTKIDIASPNSIQLKLYLPNNGTNYPDRVKLWHFTDSKGKWIENGEAILSEANGRIFYSADVKKTGYWNFANTIEVEKKSFTIQTDNLTKLQYVKTNIKSKNSNFSINLITNEKGNLACIIPKTEELELSVSLDDNTIKQDLDISKTNIDVNVDYINEKTSGSFINCVDEKIKNGYITVFSGGEPLFYHFSETSSFSENILIKKGTESLTWFATDLDNMINTREHRVEIDENGDFDLGKLVLCEESFARIKYAEDIHFLDIVQLDVFSENIYFEFEDDDYNLNLFSSVFDGVGDYEISLFTIQIRGNDGEYIFINDLKDELEISEYNKPGMMVGHFEGMARRKIDDTAVDTALLKIDFSLFIE